MQFHISHKIDSYNLKYLFNGGAAWIALKVFLKSSFSPFPGGRLLRTYRVSLRRGSLLWMNENKVVNAHLENVNRQCFSEYWIRNRTTSAFLSHHQSSCHWNYIKIYRLDLGNLDNRLQHHSQLFWVIFRILQVILYLEDCDICWRVSYSEPLDLIRRPFPNLQPLRDCKLSVRCK